MTPFTEVILQRAFSCRALSENEPEAKFEFSANGTCAFNGNEPKAKFEFSAAGTCRALSEAELKAEAELSANGTCAFNENELKAKFEFSAAGKCNILRKYISITKKGEHDEQRTGKDLRPQRNGRSYL